MGTAIGKVYAAPFFQDIKEYFLSVIFRPADKTAALVRKYVQHQQRSQSLQHEQSGQGCRGQKEEEEELGKSTHSRRHDNNVKSKSRLKWKSL